MGQQRTAGAVITLHSPGSPFSRPSLIDVRFFVAEALKIFDHVALYRQFAARPPEERD